MQAALYKDNEQCGYLDIIWSCQDLTKEHQGIINHYCQYFLLFLTEVCLNPAMIY